MWPPSEPTPDNWAPKVRLIYRTIINCSVFLLYPLGLGPVRLRLRGPSGIPLGDELNFGPGSGGTWDEDRDGPMIGGSVALGQRNRQHERCLAQSALVIMLACANSGR